MNEINEQLIQLPDPTDYFRGVGQARLSLPTDVLMFVRRDIHNLQQRALQNRSHHRFVLIYNHRTAGRIHLDNLRVHLREGQSLLIFPFQFHHFTGLDSRRLEWVFCTFECESPGYLEPLRNRVVDGGADLFGLWGELLAEWGVVDDAARELGGRGASLQVAVLRLLLRLGKALPEGPLPRAVSTSGDIVRVVNRLLSEMQVPASSVGDVAKRLGRSESRLRAMFQQEAGVSLGRYLRNYRLNRAMELLRTTDLPVSEVASLGGFGSPQAFCRSFQQAMGQTPRTYRSGA
jgi:AraC-like DNA-binding protein